MDEEPTVIDITETCRLLGVSRSKLYSLMKEQRIAPLPTPPLMKKPRRLEFLRAEVIELRDMPRQED